ncbi:MAG: M56 family metallopeptidase [Lachnospiraceae bacterium]|nr:M56 family metallopeptidase [Lachnospiraceae bacterium]
MIEFMKILLSLSVSGTLLLLLVLGLKPLYKNKFTRHWQYYIWIIVVLRLLIPFTPDTTIVGSLFENINEAVLTNESHAVSDAYDAVGVNDNETKQANEHEQYQTGTPDKTQTQSQSQIQTRSLENLFFTWAALALVLFVRKITIYQEFIRYIKAGNTEISDIKPLNLLSDCMEKLNIKAKVELYSNASVTSPIMIGLLRPSIVLPARELEDKKLPYVFLHELLHYKKKDMFYKWLIQIVICIHWFNPFVYLLEKEVNKACELSCDEAVISVLDESERREYGDTLISFMKSNNLNKGSLASVTLTEGAEQLKERLGAIMGFKKKTKLITVSATIFTIVVCFCFLAVGAYAAPSANSNSAVWEDDEIFNGILTEDGVYYIFCDGAGENDKPQSSVTDGCVKFVLVRKDSYTSIGPFSSLSTLTKDVNKQCDFMIKSGTITEEEKKLVLDIAKNIENNIKSVEDFISEVWNPDWYSKVKYLDSDFDWNDKDANDEWNFDWADEFADDKWDWDWEDEALLEEYAAYGIEKVDNLFYYQGELVYILKDQRPDSSCYLLDTNSKGTVSIKVVHNEEGKITGISYMTDEEVQELMPKLLGS